MKLNYTVQSEGKLIDILRQELDFSSRIIRKIKKEKKTTVNGILISYNARLRVGDEIEVILPEEDNIFNPEPLDIEVVYEGDQVLVVNKRPFMVVHPTKGHPFGTVANGLADYMINKGDAYKIRFANRLDRDTSGLMIVCKSGYAQKLISDQMQNNTIVKEYDALVMGLVEKDEATINEPIDRAYEDSVHRIVRPDGQVCITHYQVVKRYKDKTHVKIQLETGRTHQIRVHFQHIGHPLVGDELYGGNHELLNRQALHASRLVFVDTKGETVEVKIDLPEDMKRLME